MSTQFLSKLSKNYIELLDDDEYYDITIEVGEDPIISPEVFQIILKYIYGGTLLLNEQDTLEIFEILIAAEELFLQELINNIKDAIISNIENTEYAFYNGSDTGPYFGEDLNLKYYRRYYYEKKIREAEGIFSLEDYEVFQITK
ncbi:BTB/POZ protein [Rhizophagus irregularis DAOM 181602=DAOM 197198]|nr:BTB/POZ protein [Rhizophagus irregularis DAOM 181602=DAOM 197198]